MPEIRRYRESDEAGWLRCWRAAAGASRAWLYVYGNKPRYAKDTVELVATAEDGAVIGLLDIEIEGQPGQLCLQREKGGAFPWEFAVHPRLWGRGIGSALLREATTRLRVQWGVRYVEWWSMDPRSQRWYARRGMQCINEHWRFHVREDGEFPGARLPRGVELVHAHLTCAVEDWPEVRARLDVVEKPPLEPRLCRGYAYYL